ncbi:MAG: sigma-54 dependent transcriptional regulator, partial [Anaerovoracaceae bacterium]
ELLHEIAKLKEIKKIQKENSLLKEKVGKKQYMLTSKNKEYQGVLALARRAAQSDSSILIYGESGAGKEVVANFIHENSSRKEENFMELNCQALSESILESELFGHEKGSFTGAGKRHIGLFEAADQGTLFLDEIGGISSNLQGKLLKSIENKRIYRMGSTTPIMTDFRLITATNRNLYEDMDNDLFRSDLYYRISTIVLEIPPLRKRPEDIPLFLEHFLEIYQREMKKNITQIEPGVKEILLSYHYPGNIRELKNIVERMVVLSADGEIKEEYLPRDMLRRSEGKTQKLDLSGELSLREYRSKAEKLYIQELIQRHKGDMDKVSAVLGITRRQLLNKLTEYDLK